MLIKVKADGELLRQMSWAAEGKCFACGNVRPTTEVGAMSSDFKACEDCIRKYGPRELSREADRLLEVLTSPEWRKKLVPRIDPQCFHCRKPTFQNPDGTIPLMCQACWREYRATFPTSPPS